MENFEQKVEKVRTDFIKMEDKKINDPVNGLNVQIKKLEEMKKKNEDNFKSEFPGLDIEDTKPINFRTPEDKITYEDMQKDHKNLKKDILKLETTRTLIEAREEN